MLHVTVDQRAGEPVLVRTADGPDAPALRSARQALEAVADLPVPRVVSDTDDGHLVELVESYRPPRRTVDVAHLAQAAAVLAAAHARGVVHGRFGLDCIAADGGGQLVVTGWLGAGSPTDDVAALGAALGALAPGRVGLGDLGAAVARAGAEPPAARPGMAAMAEMLHAAASPPAARRGAPAPPGRGDARPRSGAFVATAAVVLAALTLLVGPLRPVGVAAGDAPQPPMTAPDDAAELTIAGTRWRIGGPGEHTATGDWDCDGADEPALLRTDGTVWRWTHLGGQPTLVGTAAGGTALTVEWDERGCDDLVVRDERGDAVPVHPAR